MANPTRIGAVVNTAASGATNTITVGAAGVPAGDSIVVAAFFSNGSGTPAVPTDSAGNTYVLRRGPQLDGVGGTDNGYIWVASNVLALVNGNTIVVTSPGSPSEAMIAAYDMPNALTVSFDTGNSGGNAASTAATSGDITTAQAQETLIGIIAWQSGPTTQPTLANGYTVLDYVTPASGDGAIWGYIVLSSVQSSGDAIASTLSISCAWASLMVAVKNSGGAAPAVNPVRKQMPYEMVQTAGVKEITEQNLALQQQAWLYQINRRPIVIPVNAGAMPLSGSSTSSSTSSGNLTIAVAPFVVPYVLPADMQQVLTGAIGNLRLAQQLFQSIPKPPVIPLSPPPTFAAAGTAIGAVTSIGTLSMTAALSGVDTANEVATGSTALALGLAGVDTGVSTASGNLGLTEALTSAAAVSSTAAGTLSLQEALTSTAADISTSTGVLSEAFAITGIANGIDVATGTLQVLSGAQISGPSKAFVSSSGTLSLTVVMVGTGNDISQSTGVMSLAVSFAGAESAQNTSTGALALSVGLSGQATAVDISTGTITTLNLLVLSGPSIGTSTGTASLTVSAALSGTNQVAEAGIGRLLLAIGLQGSSAEISTSTASFAFILILIGRSNAISTGILVSYIPVLYVLVQAFSRDGKVRAHSRDGVAPASSRDGKIRGGVD